MERIPKGLYSPEFGAEAVKLVEQTGMSIDRAAKQLSIPKSSLSNWVRAAKKGQLAAVGQGQRVPNEQEIELARLSRELAEVKQERDLLKKICGVFREGVAVKYDRIDGLRPLYPVAMLCRLLNVSEAGYYAWRRRPPSPQTQENARLAIEIRLAHERTRQTYGPERLQAELADHGIHAGVDRIKRIRRELGLRCRQKRKFRVTTDSRHNLPIAPNLLDRQFVASVPNRAWVTDITYVATDEGWLYLAGIKDLFNGELVGYALDERMTQNLVMQALFRAVAARRPEKGLVHHSDRGSQYCAYAYQRLLRQFGMQVSMSRKGNCWDNAPMESCWGSLKTELIHHRRFATRDEAKREITEYIEIFYNRIRKQARLGYLSPAAFMQKHYSEQMAA